MVLLGSVALGAASHAQSSGVPTITGAPPASAAVGSVYAFTPTVTVPAGQSYSLSISNLPSWATFDETTGRLAGTPTASDIGLYSSIRILLRSGQAFISLPLFSIEVLPANRAPTIGGTPAASVTAGKSYSFTPTASDADGDALTFSITGKPAWASFSSSSGRLSGSPGSSRIGSYPNIVIRVSDGEASASLPAFSINVVGPNAPPTIDGTPAGSVTAGNSYSFTPSASDDDGDALTFSIANKPAWASFSSATGRLSGSPGSSRIGTYPNIVISVSDGQASASLPPFTIDVLAANSPPSVAGTPGKSVTAGKSYSFTPTASDADGDALTFSITGKPAWASFSSSTGRLRGSPGSSRIGTYPDIVISVSDGQASASLPPFSIDVVGPNAPPTIDGTPAGSVTAGNSYSFTPSASDDDGDALTFSIANKPAWASFSSATGRLSGTPGSTRVGTYSNIVISVSDGQASTALAPFTITVVAATSGSATVSWSPPTTFVDGTPIKNLAGYRVVYGASPSDLSSMVNIPSPAITSAVIEALTPGTWYFAVKAYTTASIESDLSTVVYKIVN